MSHPPCERILPALSQLPLNLLVNICPGTASVQTDLFQLWTYHSMAIYGFQQSIILGACGNMCRIAASTTLIGSMQTSDGTILLQSLVSVGQRCSCS